MAKFNFTFQDRAGGTHFSGDQSDGKIWGVDEVLEILRPAALRLREIYQAAIRSTFRQRTGSLADSIDIEDDTVGQYYAFITVKPFGTHKGGSITRRSRAGSSSRKYAKHNRSVSKKKIKNEELLYLLEVGTPRIAATHVLEYANEAAEEEIQDIIENGIDELLKKKGLT